MCHGCVNGTEKFSLHEEQENEANHSQFSVKEERKACWFDFNECCFCSSLACGFFHSHWNPFHSGLYPEKGKRPVKKCTVVNFGAIQTNEVMIVMNFKSCCNNCTDRVKFCKDVVFQILILVWHL